METHKQNKRELILPILIIVVAFIAIFFLVSHTIGFFQIQDKGLDAYVKLSCFSYFNKIESNKIDLSHLCDNENCSLYFEEQIKLNHNSAEACLK